MSIEPQERWRAAVALQHAAAREVEWLPLTRAGDQEFCDRFNAAVNELDDARHELIESGAGRPDPAEWTAAYSVHRDAARARDHRKILLYAALSVEHQRQGVCDLLARIPHLVTG